MSSVNVNSHVLKFSRLAEGLSKEGHTIRMILPSNNKMASVMSLNENFSVIHYPVDCETPFTNSRLVSETMIRIAFSESPFLRIKLFSDMEIKLRDESVEECESLLASNRTLDMLKNEGFEFAIMDPWSAVGCFFLLPKMLNIPFAIYTVSVSWHNIVAKIPRLASFTPFISTDWSDTMCFQERLLAFIFEILAQIKFGLSSELETKYARKYLDPNVETSYNEILSEASLWFFEEDLSLNYPAPHMPNSISIVNIGEEARPVKPLPEDLKYFLRSSTDPAILVSFGALFDYVPEFISQGFCDAFRQLKYQVIWKLKNESHCMNVKNVKILDWIPQNDLLAHEKVRLFVTHGGYNSMIETVYHAKPVLILPIAYDQINNAAFVVNRGLGIRMYFSQFTVDNFVSNINEIFADPKFAINMRKASAIMRDQPSTAAEKASHLINHVLKYGDKHLKTSAHELSLFQFYMFDIFLFICVAAILCFVLLSTCIYWTCKYATGRIQLARKLKQV